MSNLTEEDLSELRDFATAHDGEFPTTGRRILRLLAERDAMRAALLAQALEFRGKRCWCPGGVPDPDKSGHWKRCVAAREALGLA
jgi:hypothetical protein